MRAAAKNFRDVLVVVDPADYPAVLAALDRPSGPDARVPLRPGPPRHRPHRGLRHDHRRRRSTPCGSTTACRRAAPTALAPARLVLEAREAPRPALRRESRTSRRRGTPIGAGPGLGARDRRPGQGAVLHQPARPRCRGPHRPRVRRAGRRGDQAHQPVRRRHRRRAPPRPTWRAREADALSAFGGIVGLNRPLDAETASALTATFIEAVDRRRRSPTRRAALLAAKPNLRVVIMDTAAFRRAGSARLRGKCARCSAACWSRPATRCRGRTSRGRTTA